MDIIAVNYELQVIHCRMCHAHLEIPRYVAGDPDRMLQLKQGFRQHHEPCQKSYETGLKIKFFSRPASSAQRARL